MIIKNKKQRSILRDRVSCRDRDTAVFHLHTYSDLQGRVHQPITWLYRLPWSWRFVYANI